RIIANYRSQRMHWGTNCSPSYGCSVGDQIQHSRMERRETEPDHEGAGNGDGRAESRAAFQKSSEAEGHQEQLHPPVRRITGQRFLHDLEMPGVDRKLVKIDSSHYDPDNFQQAE